MFHLRPSAALAALLAGLLLPACISEPWISPPPEPIRKAQNERFLAAIQAVARPGDWLVNRGYKFTDDMVVHATQIPLSHAALYDAENAQVIEAEGKGIHTSSLHDFIDKSHRVHVIRPRWATDETRKVAVQNARALVGRGYDFLGTVGFDRADRLYCSELVMHVYRQWQTEDDHIPRVIEPGQLYLWGQVVYDTLPRTKQ